MEATSAWPELNKSVSVGGGDNQLNEASDYPDTSVWKKLKVHRPDMDDVSEAPSAWRRLDKPRRRAYLEGDETDSKCKIEVGRLLDERTFWLTKSGSKFVSTGLDPLKNNEPTLQVRNRVHSKYISFRLPELEELLSSIPKILQSIEDIPYKADENSDPFVSADDKYKIIAELRNYNVLLLPYRVVKFRHNVLSVSVFDNVCMCIDTLKVFARMGEHFICQLYELRRRSTQVPRMEYFASELATKVVRDNGGTVNDECAFYVIKESCNDNCIAHDLYIKYYHHLLKEVDRIVAHMQTYNNYDF